MDARTHRQAKSIICPFNFSKVVGIKRLLQYSIIMVLNEELKKAALIPSISNFNLQGKITPVIWIF